MRRIRRRHVLVAAIAGALCVPASGVSSAADSSLSMGPPPTNEIVATGQSASLSRMSRTNPAQAG